VRVIAGSAKGHPLTAPRGERTRPTADRVKEALFSSVQARLPGAVVLDLYAGSGALGIEALSRGAAHAVLVEQDHRARRCIGDNLDTTRLAGRATVVAGSAPAVCRAPAVAERTYDLVLADPPYAVDPDELTATLAAVVGLLAPDALVVVELGSRGAPPAWPEGLRAGRTRRYGETALHEGHPVPDAPDDPAPTDSREHR
jgi:16S rRNA (guanine966-N2)-methyltransferase